MQQMGDDLRRLSDALHDAEPKCPPMTTDDCKRLRDILGTGINVIRAFDGGSRERSLALRKLQEARMWLGQELGNLGETDLNAERDSGQGFRNTGR